MPEVTRVAGFEFALGDPTLTLLVARRRLDHVDGGMVNVLDEALDALRQLTRDAMDGLDELEARRYDPDAQLEDGQFFAIDRADVHDSFGVLELLDRGPDAELWSVDDLAHKPLLFYALVVGRNPEARTAFVAKSNPARTAHRGLPLTPRRGSLANIGTPVFIFEDRVDLIVNATRMAVLNQLAFEQWFRDTPILRRRVGAWIGNIAQRLPISGDGARQLAEHCRTNSRLRRVLYSIEARGHLATVTLPQVREHIAGQGLDEAALIRTDKLVFDEADPATLLKLLNEDLFLGGLTRTPFVVDRKAPRPQ